MLRPSREKASLLTNATRKCDAGLLRSNKGAILRRMRWASPFIAAIALCVVICARADELKLKDGTKIVGTIVGFEENSFKVKTSYGFAVVQKDEVVSISMTDSAKKPEVEKKADAAAEKPPVAPVKPAKTDAAAIPIPSPTKLSSSAEPPTNSRAMSARPVPITKTAPATVDETLRNGNANPSAAKNASAPPTTAAPPNPAAPEPIHEEVNGNTYTNDTYGFRMYKPPGWQVIDGAHTLLPGAITAMGTGDQNTYLLIGQDAGGKSLASDMDATEKRLREVLDNFRPLGDKRITVSGSGAIERRFRGSVDQHDWSGIVALVPHGTRVYMIFGMTSADTDLVQIQENVISRAISSLQFTKQ
jgi:hypothetical protein